MPSRVASVPSTVRWVGNVAPEVTEAGVSPAIPDCASSVAVSARCPAAACSSSMPGAAANPAQSEVDRTSAMVCTDPTAMPEYEATAAAERPGITSNSTELRDTPCSSLTTGSAVSTSPATNRTTN